MRPALFAITAALLTLAQAQAATVNTDILPTEEGAIRQVTVAPGGTVEYMIIADVLSDDTSGDDSRGMTSFVIDVITDLGVAQPPATTFGPEAADAFILLPQLGFTGQNDRIGDIIQIGGAQGFTGQIEGLGQDETIILAVGELDMPDAEGTYTVQIGEDASFLVLALDPSTVPLNQAADVQVGQGFEITVQAGAQQHSGGPIDGGDGGDGGGDGGDDTDQDQRPWGTTLVLAGGLVLGLAYLGYMFAGPIGSFIGMIIGMLVSLLVI